MTEIKKLNLVSVAGLVLVFGGLIGITLGIFLWGKANEGLASLDAVYAVQGRMMTYDDEGNFTDRGTAEAGSAIPMRTKVTRRSVFMAAESSTKLGQCPSETSRKVAQ